MVAQPGVTIAVAPMTVADLDAVHDIEKRSFRTPWPSHAYKTELETNRLAHYVVARADGVVVGYGGMWVMVDEAHITTFAVVPERRRERIGERLLLALMDRAQELRAREATLEVRLSNLPARRLYEKYGFRPVGLRPRYYTDDNEDALIMTTEPFASPRLRERLARLRRALAETPDGSRRTEGAREAGPAGSQPDPNAPDRSELA